MHRQSIAGIALALAATFLVSPSAQAQLFRAYLAPDGSDANTCTLQQPCRLLPAALNAVASGGEIWMLDSANYNTGPVNITKSVTILAVPGALGSVVATGGDAINIATGGVSVALRNLVIVPLLGGGGLGGINMTAGNSLVVENCLLAGVAGVGIAVTTAATVRITDATIRGGSNEAVLLAEGATATLTRVTLVDNGGRGVHVNTSAAGTLTTAYILHSTISGNCHGVVAYSTAATATVKVSVKDSLIVHNQNVGVISQSASGASVLLSASSNTIAGNSNGILSNTGGKVWASGNTVSDNVGCGMCASGGVIETAGNNSVRNNAGGDTSGTITVIAQK